MDSKTYTDRLENRLQEIFRDCDNECQGGNYHHLVGLCESIFESVSSFIPLDDRIQVAQEIWQKISKTF